jgi:polyhydroxyalkanoate synthesis regulator phasin
MELKDEQFYVLIEMTIALIRKGVLTDEQGKAMLQNLVREDAQSQEIFANSRRTSSIDTQAEPAYLSPPMASLAKRR